MSPKCNSLKCVLIENAQKDLKISKSSAEKLTVHLLKELHCHTHQVTIHFISEKAISKLHTDFFQDPTSTDCISFPMDPPDAQVPFHVLGEIFVCPKVALLYGNQHGIDPYEETSRYVIHGLLHLYGFEDEKEHLRKQMKKKENALLNQLKKRDLLLKNS